MPSHFSGVEVEMLSWSEIIGGLIQHLFYCIQVRLSMVWVTSYDDGLIRHSSHTHEENISGYKQRSRHL